LHVPEAAQMFNDYCPAECASPYCSESQLFSPKQFQDIFETTFQIDCNAQYTTCELYQAKASHVTHVQHLVLSRIGNEIILHAVPCAIFIIAVIVASSYVKL
jgi:hypothetical protein